jgi:hypothetical protein
MKCLLCNTDLQENQCMNCSSDEMKVYMLADVTESMEIISYIIIIKTGLTISKIIWFNMGAWAIATLPSGARYTLYKKLENDDSYRIVDHYHLSCPKLNVSNVKSFLDRILALLIWQ